MSKLARLRVVAAEIESALYGYGVDAMPDGSDAVLVEEISWGLEGLRMVERPAIRSSIGVIQQVYGGSLMAATFQAEVKGSGAAGTPPELGKLFRGCAMSETIVGGTSVTYKPISYPQESITLYLWEDGTLTKLIGCRGGVSFTGAAGGRLMANFSFIGHFSGPTDVALPTPTYDSTVPPILIGGSLAVHSYTPALAQFDFATGNQIETPSNINAADGYSEVRVTGRDVAGQIDPEQPLVATKDFMAALKAGTTGTLDSGVFGATAGNRFQVTMPAVYFRGLAPGVREGVQVYELPFGAAESSGNDEFSLIFT